MVHKFPQGLASFVFAEQKEVIAIGKHFVALSNAQLLPEIERI